MTFRLKTPVHFTYGAAALRDHAPPPYHAAMRRICPTRPAAMCILTLLVCCAAGGCSFDRRWRNLSRDASATPQTSSMGLADPLAGRWEGKWVSEQTGHSGQLRAIVDRVDANTYHIDYDAWFFGVLRYTHGMNVTATRETGADAIRFQGEENLGSLAGVYRYDGTADGRAFKSTYQSKDDHGTFEMKRPTE